MAAGGIIMTNNTSSRSRQVNVSQMVKIAVLIAIMLILNYTPLGYLRIGPVEITFLQIPVVVGAIMLGPAAGALLGLVFGITSLAQAPVSPVFAPAFTTVPVLIAIVCIVPRVLVGWLSGLFFRAVRKTRLNGLIGYAMTGFLGSVLNTVLFISGVVVVLGKYIESTMAALDLLTGKTVAAFWAGIAAVNGIPEAIATAIIVAAVCKALSALDKHLIKM